MNATAQFVADPTVEHIAAAVRAVTESAGRTALVFLAETDAPALDALVEGLCATGRPFLGGLFPAVIHQADKHDRGAVVCVLPAKDAPCLIEKLSEGGFTLPDRLVSSSAPSVLTIVDGLASRISGFLSELYKAVGSRRHYFGGGAGSLSLQPTPCLFTADGVFQDAALLLPVDANSQLGVGHGWRRLHGPVLATRCEGNVVHELNWMPAFELYKQVVEADANVELTADGFFDVAKGYPLGLARDDDEPIIRDPISVTDSGALVCVGEVPEHAAVGIYRGENERLIGAAGEVISQCLDGARRDVEVAIVADCISRSIYLEDEFSRELSMVADRLHEVAPAAQLAGALTLGEVSSIGDSYLEFHNKTLVVATLTP